MLSRLFPAPIVRFFARPYLAGFTREHAFRAAGELLESGLLSTLDLLGEDVTEPQQIDTNVRVYTQLIDAIARDARFGAEAARPTVSLKPSAFTVNDREAAFGPIRQLVEHASSRAVGITIDMEDHRWTDVTLEHSVQLYREGHDVGTVLQSRLLRTPSDIEAIPAGMRVRLVIGIYPEPAEIALTDKREMKERLIELSAQLLERGGKPELATHDEAYVERFARELAPRAPDRVEVQMLLGVPRSTLQQQLIRGDFGTPLPVRLYVPFAINRADATAYLRRRMDESPSMIFSVLRNLATFE